MTEDMKVRVELWPIAGDPASLWLLSGLDAWRSPNLQADHTVHGEVEAMLAPFTPHEPVLIHSTSWRPHGPAVLLTYVAVFDPGRELALGMVEGAKPITLEQAEAWGKPYAHEATEPPIPRRADVLEHALGHLRWLRGGLSRADARLRSTDPCMNSKVRAALAGTGLDPWLDLFTPTLAGRYVEDAQAA